MAGFASPGLLSSSFSGVHRLVDDVLFLCLAEAVGSPHGDYIDYVRRRVLIVGVSRRFRNLVYAASTLWSRLVVTQHVPLAVVRCWLDRARQAPLYIELVFEGVELFYRPSSRSASERLCIYAVRVLALLLPRILQWVAFKLVVDDAATSALLLHVLSGQRAPRLARVDLACACPIFGVIMLSIGPIALLPPPFFEAGVPVITHLRLTTLGLHWRSFPVLRHLVELELCDISVRCLPTFFEYCQLLQGACELKRLVLRGLVLNSQDLLDGQRPRQPCVLPLLEVLVLEFKGSISMGWLVGSFDMPRLWQIDLRVQDYYLDGFTDCVHFYPPIFQDVTSLILRGEIEDVLDADALAFPARLFGYFRSVAHLDLLHASPSVFQRLVDVTATSALEFGYVLLPALKHIMLSQETAVQTLKDFVLFRAECDGVGLAGVELDHSPAQLTDEARQELLELVGRDVVLRFVEREEVCSVTKLSYAEGSDDLL
ncbi:hypothetical protein C8J57DRAFT_1541936 [Mycena rebaudengoi]|nr:hypothetical protein C8J57DRAFT_1541936 [Mycena rebaudengoi]